MIARNGKPAARLVALAAVPARQPGGWEGRVWMAADFDEADTAIEAIMLRTDGPE